MSDTTRYFAPEQEYKRIIFGHFSAQLLEEYAEIAIDSPQLQITDTIRGLSVIVLPETVGRADFMNLVGWLNQEGNDAYGIALHSQNGYRVVFDHENPYGDTVNIGFDNGLAGIWELPTGFLDEGEAFAPAERRELTALDEGKGEIDAFLAAAAEGIL